MPDYVTRGTVQFAAGPVGDSVRINPTEDYAVRHAGVRYIVFISLLPPTAPTSTQVSTVEQDFRFRPGLKDILEKSAFARACLEVTINNVAEIIGVTVPAKP